AERYREVFGYYPEGREIEVTSVRVVASTRPAPEETEDFPRIRVVEWRDGEGEKWPFYDRKELDAGDFVAGPAVIQDRFSTFVVEAGWEAVVGSLGTIRVERLEAPGRLEKEETEVVELELYTNRLRGIAEEMGVQLQRTALSTNIKERLDFSCAILDADGFLVVNAPHVPVHLGAMGLCVREVMRRHRFRPGDMILTNHPGIGGSHLPDLTLIAPVFFEGKRIGFVANRAHHAEMGGVRPGSMPPSARSLVEEGVVISPVLLFDRGVARYEVIEEILANAPWPSRAVADNLTDLQAQAAANLRGAEALVGLAAAGGSDRLVFYLEKLKAQSAAAAAKVLDRIGGEERRARQELDDGFAIEVALKREDGQLVFDFAGTSSQHPGSFNATPAIVHSAVLYGIRVLVGEEIPLNEGLMERIEIRLPHGLLHPVFSQNPDESPAVVAGNVETSQRLVDTLLLAFEAAACSQGTMNNFVFGNENYSFYETICGGSGAGDCFHGTSAVHTHMTNTAITDPEVLEFRYPVRLVQLSIRSGSGGKGRWQGGDGIIREFLFLEPMSVSLLTQHRVQEPYGLRGGKPGSTGRQTLLRVNGERGELPFSAELEVQVGDRVRIETPGGGGWGKDVKEAY
ncbi:MAG TPA: hydantoinase B/oxoprolinase family protein, partial [Opitutales bacterium]|nr:hydantoinase B/oxoprolinase family protein [Opitutales bacterium]